MAIGINKLLIDMRKLSKLSYRVDTLIWGLWLGWNLIL